MKSFKTIITEASNIKPENEVYVVKDKDNEIIGIYDTEDQAKEKQKELNKIDKETKFTIITGRRSEFVKK